MASCRDSVYVCGGGGFYGSSQKDYIEPYLSIYIYLSIYPSVHLSSNSQLLSVNSLIEGEL